MNGKRTKHLINSLVNSALPTLKYIMFGGVYALCSILVAQALTPTQTPAAASEPIVMVRWATEQEQVEHDRETVEAIAKTVWGEARGCTTTEQAAVVWCVLNRVDSPDFPDDPLSVVVQRGQFSGYSPNHPADPELVALTEDVMTRWTLEKTAVGSVGRVLPSEYVFFVGDGLHNIFRVSYEQTGEIWNWTLPSPYEE